MSRVVFLFCLGLLLVVFFSTGCFGFGDYYDCEATGAVTINEVYDFAQTSFVEVKVNSEEFSGISLLKMRICRQQGNQNSRVCTVYDLEDFENYHPYYVISLPQGVVRLENNAQMDIALYRESGFFMNRYVIYDYLSVNGYDYQEPPCNLRYDTEIDTTSNYKGIARVPDGTGDWQQEAGPGNHADNTRGGSNDGEDDPAVVEAVLDDLVVQSCSNAQVRLHVDPVVLPPDRILAGAQLRFSYDGPGLNPAATPVIYAGQPYAAGFPISLDLVFTAEGNLQAPIELRYNDAGRLRLQLTYADASLSLAASGTVLFYPSAFRVTSPLDNATAAGAPKLAAGLPFAATVTAVCGDGTVTPNFAWPTQLSVTDVQPSGGRAGVLAPTSLVAADFSAGRATPDLTYSEVGNVTLQAQAANYLGSGREISGSGQIGRFMPHHFRLTPGSLIPRVDSGCVPAATFTYLDEPLALSFTLAAENAANDRTQNYVGAYAKFSGDEDEAAPAGEVYLLTAVDAPGGSATSLSGRLQVDGRQRDSGWAAGSADFCLRLRLARAALPLPPDGPFNDVRFGVVLQDADGVAIAALDLDSDGDGVADSAQAAGAAVLRQGRLRLVNAHGSELLPLALPVLAEYYNGTSFVPHGADSCTALALTDFSFVADPAGLPGADAFTPLVAGAGALNWTSGPGSPGAVTVTAELAALPWLQFDWNADASYDNPTARATFGIYKGSERIIYLRETTWR